MPLVDINQELMTPDEAAKWFRRSPSWLRQQHEILRVGGPGGQPLFHVRVCRAYVLGRLCRLSGPALRNVQIAALAQACGVSPGDALLTDAVQSGASPVDEEQARWREPGLPMNPTMSSEVGCDTVG